MLSCTLDMHVDEMPVPAASRQVTVSCCWWYYQILGYQSCWMTLQA